MLFSVLGFLALIFGGERWVEAVKWKRSWISTAAYGLNCKISR